MPRSLPSGLELCTLRIILNALTVIMIYGRELPGYPYNLKAKLTRCLVAGRRELFGKLFKHVSSHAQLPVCANGQAANDIIRGMVEADRPFLITRFGSYEMEALLRGIDVQDSASALKKIGRMLIGEGGPFWWDNSIRGGLCWNAGFFPPTDEALNAYSNRFCNDIPQIDLIGTTYPGEKYIATRFAPHMKAVPLLDLEPFGKENPWSKSLVGMKVLVVHPFEDSIRAQYARRKILFDDPDFLPDFELKTYRAISSFAGNKVPYDSWFEALAHMCADISRIEFDIAIIGCGAYGMHIGAFIKRDMGRKAFHLCSPTQLLFGIKGGRWDTWPWYRDNFYNKNWIRPLASDIVLNTNTVEGGCYW